MDQITKVLEGIYNDLELRDSCIPLFMSNPGLGKTTIIKQFAEYKKVKCLVEIASTKMPHEFSGMAMPDNENKRMTFFDYDSLLDLKDGDILFLDELLNANSMILNAFLTVLEDRVLPSGKKLAKIMIVAAANPQGAAMLTPQIKERFIFYNIDVDKGSWKQYMSRHLITDDIYDSLFALVKNEPFNNADKNYMTPRSVDKAVKMIVRGVDTPYAKKIEPILNTFVHNKTESPIQINDYTLGVNEKITWLNLIRKKYEIVTEQEDETPVDLPF